MKYDIRLRVSEKMIAPVLSNVGPQCEFMGLIPVTEEMEGAAATPKRQYVGNIRNKGITGKELIMQVLRQEPLRPHTHNEIKQEFVKHKFSANSVAPLLFALRSKGEIINLGDGRYCIQGATVKLGANSNV